MNSNFSIQVQGSAIGTTLPSRDSGLLDDWSDNAPAASEVAQFRSALERHTQARSSTPADDAGKVSLSDRLIERTVSFASNIQKDQQYVSKLLEQATRTGDSMHLMKAMLALNDYQIRVQAVSKTVSKATSALEQLTKLQ